MTEGILRCAEISVFRHSRVTPVLALVCLETTRREKDDVNIKEETRVLCTSEGPSTLLTALSAAVQFQLIQTVSSSLSHFIGPRHIHLVTPDRPVKQGRWQDEVQGEKQNENRFNKEGAKENEGTSFLLNVMAAPPVSFCRSFHLAITFNLIGKIYRDVFLFAASSSFSCLLSLPVDLESLG